jgi:hypothetical protein
MNWFCDYVSDMIASLCITGVDTSGGVRVPAGFCGILGFRPSHGAVSHVGIIPVSTSLDTVGMYDSFYHLFWFDLSGCFVYSE